MEVVVEAPAGRGVVCKPAARPSGIRRTAAASNAFFIERLRLQVLLRHRWQAQLDLLADLQVLQTAGQAASPSIHEGVLRHPAGWLHRVRLDLERRQREAAVPHREAHPERQRHHGHLPGPFLRRHPEP